MEPCVKPGRNKDQEWSEVMLLARQKKIKRNSGRDETNNGRKYQRCRNDGKGKTGNGCRS